MDAFRIFADFIIQSRPFQTFHNPAHIGIFLCLHRYILCHGKGWNVNILEYCRKKLHQFFSPNLTGINTVNQNLPAVRLIKAAEQFHRCCFSCAVYTHKGNFLPTADMKREILEHRL